MSSVTRFLRQRVVGTTTLSASSAQLYIFIAGAGATGSGANALLAQSNYVGNYPPGYLVAGPTVANLQVAAQGGLINPILRDMGKTIRASLATATDGQTLGAPGFWRQVQVLDPSVVSSPTASTNFGVTGQAPGNRPTLSSGNVGDDGYNTYYIPIEVNGVVPGTAATPSVPIVSTAALVAGNVL
jgi:hypothetical protein